MIRSGNFVVEHIETADEDAVQPNGVDLSIGKIYAHASPGRLTDGDYEKPERRELSTVTTDAGEFYDLAPGAYVVEYAETVEIPENHIGFIFPRSRLMRCGGMLFSAVWDSGYRGKGEGGLWIEQQLEIEAGMRIGQMVFSTTEELDEFYDGSHQGENL
ncbi:MAG: deoxyuridine 5'-triphosphate nucleotidohydrolase [Halobacteria archaeon]|nr:deoxyuridine 5'-triphosphate nucleotidohydrolase [Halobacteria archaeon]